MEVRALLRFLHVADLHLDSPFIGLKKLPPTIRQELIQSTFKAYDRIIEYAIANKVDFVLIAGDVFDQANRSLKAQLQFVRGLDKLAQAGIYSYIVHGNHDPLDGIQWPIELPDRVHIFSGRKVETVPFIKQGKKEATIQGISYATRQVSENLSLDYKHQEECVFSIGLLHTNVDGSKGHENYAPCSLQDLVQSGLNYWALGHVHTRKVLHEAPYIVYPGNTQGRHSREQGEKGFYDVQVNSSEKVQLQFRPVQEIIWIEREVEVTGIEHINELRDLLENECHEVHQQWGHNSILLRIRGVGQTLLAESLSQPETLQALLDEVQENQKRKSAFLWIESFRFEGTLPYDREDLKEGNPLYADMLQLFDNWNADKQVRDKVFEEALGDIVSHYRARVFLEEWSEDEQKEILAQVETLLLQQMIGGTKG
jgi:exonuclease SbcD